MHVHFRLSSVVGCHPLPLPYTRTVIISHLFSGAAYSSDSRVDGMCRRFLAMHYFFCLKAKSHGETGQQQKKMYEKLSTTTSLSWMRNACVSFPNYIMHLKIVVPFVFYSSFFKFQNINSLFAVANLVILQKACAQNLLACQRWHSSARLHPGAGRMSICSLLDDASCHVQYLHLRS